ncbi:SCO-spondin, partial [Caerostris darwini]
MKIKLPKLLPMVRCLWIICFLIGISIGQRVKGGSQSYQQSSQRFSEYQSGGTAYGTQEASNWPCIKPEEFRNGRRSCSITNDRFGRIYMAEWFREITLLALEFADPGYKFPNGKDELVLDCSRQTGHWIPYRKFECIGSGGYGQNSYQQSHGSGYGQSSSVSQGSYSRSFSHSSSGQASNAAQNSYGGGSSYTQHSSTQGHSTGLCGSTPNSPSHGNLSCSMSNEKWTCIFTCLPGYKFADGNSQATHICYEKDGYWFPKKEFDDCIGSGGGSSGRQYSQQRVSSSSYSSSGQYGHGGGSNYGQQSSMQGYGQGLCGQPASLRRGSQSCGNVNGQVTCRASCPPGYQFPDGANQTTHTCHDREGRWLPKKDFDECIYIGGSSYGQSSSQQHFGQGLCGQPASLRRGSQSCGNANGQVTCRAACPPGYQFPDGTNQTTHTCHDRDGRWLPKKDFDECIYMGGSSYGHSSSQQTSYGGGSYSRQHSSQQSQSSGLCGSPRNPIYGFHSCSMSANKWTCQITCNPGYEFSDGSRQVITTCNERDGRWSPKMDFGDCRLLCHPPCQNGGQCALHNTCQCPPTHRGNRCQYATSLCDFNRLSSSVYAACEHFPEYSECKISCPAGMTFDPLSSSVYRCTVDGLWNPPRAPTCKIDSLCEKPPLPMHGNVSCTGNHEIMICSGLCLPGYAFENGFAELSLQCVLRTGEWTPDQGFPDCEPICSPECMHGGNALVTILVFVPRNTVGPDVNILATTVISTNPPQPTVYICRVDGTWQPDLKPICVTDYSLIDARNRQHGGYQSHETRSGVQQNRGSTSQRVNSRQQNLGGYENYGVQQQVDYDEYEEQQQQQQQTRNFGGQQQVDYEFGGQQPVDYDFGGQQQVDYEFGHNAYSNNQVGEIPAQKVESYETHQTHGGNSRVSHEVSNDRQKQGLEDFDVDLPDQTEVQDEFEETYRLTDEDAQEIMDEIGDDNEVNSEFSIFSEKRMVSTYHGICTTWGFFHYRTFNGEVYTFPSTCWYLLAASTTDDFAISIRSDCSGDTVCLRVVSVQLANYKYLLSYSDGLMRNGVQLQIPIQDENLVVEYISRYLVAKTQFGYTIWINEENTVLLVAEPYVQNKTKGMCGNYDGTPDALFLASDGSKTPDIFTFTTSWKMENIDGVCVDEAELKQPCTSESREKRMEADKSNLACAAFLDIEFHKCTQVLNLEVYYRQCQMDCCNMGAEESCQCTSMGEFVLECSRAGVDMNKGWRQPGLCPLGCTNGSVYNECGPACPPTCRDLQPVCNFQKCVDGCHCPTGTVLEKGQCISKDLCPCHYGSEHFDSGETIQQDCNACVCQGGNWKCTDSICPATCSIAGPHFTTFDGFPYDFQGKCSYYLVDSDDFNIRIDYGTNCKEKTSGVCIKGITIHTPEEAVVKLKPSMDVTVNGREMESLPIKAPGIYIGQSTSSFMRAQLKNGLEILWDLGPNIQVFAPVELFDSLKGLCGTFTKNQQDEFLTPEGDIETSAGSFTQKWRVEETCRDVEDPIDSEGGEKACDRYSERREIAIEVCNVLKGSAFEGCHDLLDYERYFSDCMEDVCSCEEDPVTCTCLSLANYAYACARKGKPLSWRPSVPACGIACPLGLVYVSCADPCSYTCNEIANVPTECRESCVEGCVCPPGKALNEHGQCVYMSSCSCVHSGHFYPPDFVQRRGKEMCECSQGHWDCYEATAADLILTPPTNIAMECDRSAHLMPTDCMTDCPLTCTNYLHHQPCTVAACHPGCMCQNGYVLDATSGACVEPYNCPCHHGGKSYEEGEEVKMDCNKCVCEGGSWNCDSHSCPGLCSAWGDSHFETFDGNLYDFEGTCEYVLVKARINDNEFFSVIFQNVPCGMGSEATCGKAISVTLGGTSISLTRLHPLPSLPENSRLTVTPIGMFTLVESDIGISVQWDRNTRVYVTAQPIWKNKMQGLCGDFNGDASDDFRSPSGGMPLVLAKDFADSWRVHKFCPRAKHPDDACGRNPERRTWARHKCSVLKTDLFKPCHYQVEVEDYYKRCVTDACACNLGGDCECVCAVIGAYAQKCARRGVVIPWRSQEVCPVQCDTCDRYSPCISLCPPVNCDTYLIPLEQQSCSREHCVDGCAPKPCKPGYIHKSATNLTCIPEDMCDDKPCIEIDGVAYREGERIEREDVGDACQSCYCRNGEVECLGVPCTYSTMEPFISTIAPQACEFTGWTDWINTRDPEDNEGRDYENLDDLALTHRIPLPSGSREEKTVYAGECLDYEVRVFCQCHEEATCPPEQEWEECAFDCENSCQSLVADLQQNSLCVEEKCAPGCVKTPCQLPLVARDAETCVKPEQCTCKLDSGFIVAPGQVITNGCEKCQCMNNTLICSTTLECQQTLAPEIKSQIKPERFEVTTVKPKTKTSRPRGGISGLGGGGIALTTPACSFWSHWINKSKPKNGKKAKEREDTRAYILQQTEGFCQEGTITTIECREVETDLDYTQTNQEKLVCSLNVGFVCKNRFQPDGRCKDYKIRYLCSCSEATTPVPIFIKTTTPAYTYPCSDFVPLIDGPHPLPDTSLKASSSRSSLTGPDAARFKNYETRKAWTPEDSNEKQFIEIDLGQVRGVYGIITKGKDSSKEWVSSYQLLYSKNGNSYSYYQDEADKNKVFSGNFDGTTEVKHLFKPPFEAKLVRLEPLTWVGKISLRLELLGCSEALTTLSPEEEEEEGRILPIHIPTTTPAPIAECLEPMGLENGALIDSQLSASSSYSSTLTPENVRLGSDSVWSVAYSDDKQYLQIDFLDEANVTGIITKGREDEPQWVTAYTVSYSNDGIIWNKIKDEDDEDSLKEFAANYDSFSVVSNELPAMIRTRFLRIHPTKWKDWISMQIEILGCYRPLPCRDPMGIDEGVILNYQLTSSSELSKSKAAPHGRLSSLSSWTPSKDDKHQFLQVDLLEPVKVTGIITKGDPELQQWVKSYNVAYSNDSIDWKKTQNVHGKVKEFHGNNDQDSPVINLLPISIISRYIRIIPVKWHRWTSLRVSLLGCVKEQVCREPMGLENNVLPDAQITASSTLDWTSSPSHARISDPSGWVASPYDSTPYLQVDFREPRNVSAVVTKGVGTNDFWVNKFKVLHSDNADKWLPITDDYGDIIEYQGNDDSDTPVINTFPEPVEDRYFRLVPLSYNNKPGLRLELLGCYHPYVCQEPLGMESGTIYDFQITASSSLNPELYPVNARLDSDTAWAPKLDDSDPYIQVDLIVPTNITGVMTRGRNDANEWVKTYEIEFSDNGLEWESQETGYVVEHKGNTDNESPVTNLFPEPMFSRFIRIKPTSSERKIGLRFEILGCFEEKVCMEPMGIESGLMPEGQISASSSKTEILSPEIIRLNSEIGWSVSTVEVPQFLQVDFGEPRNLSAVVIQGSPEEPEWVTAFLVTHSNDEEEWQPVTNDKDEPVEFPGNVDNDTPVISVFPETIEAQYIRIIPTDWKKWISLRLEILGCYHPY